MPPVTSETSRWFAEEVQPHESALRVYLKARFPGIADHDDLVQETYTRLLRARMGGSIRHTRTFLFTTARNAAIDILRRRRARPVAVIPESDAACVLDEARASAPELLHYEQGLRILTDALHALPERCRQALVLRYLEGLSYREIADRMEISQETVKTQLAKGLRRCADYCSARGLEHPVVLGAEGSP
jgi:RNA polymerase sigma-70 factor (ECF subfamily)